MKELPEPERRRDYGELVKKIDSISVVIHVMKGKQSVIDQYLQVQFGGKDLIGTPMEGNVTRALRELTDKVKIQNGKVNRLENWRWYACGAVAVIVLLLTLHKP